MTHAEPNFLRYPVALPNDPAFAEQWGWVNTGQAHLISDPDFDPVQGTSDADADVDAAWDITTGSPDVVVAVIDSGADLDHPDLVNKLWMNPGEVDDGIDNDGNGYIDDLHGWDFYDDDNEPQGSELHGTHVAGIIGAEADNDEGIAGVCPGCSLMILRAGNRSFSTGAMVQAIEYATASGADIINMSIGGGPWSMFERQAIEDAGASGILSVISAGNEDRDNDQVWDDNKISPPSFPASYDLDTIVSIAASNHDDEYGYETGCAIQHGDDPTKCWFSNYGAESVDLAAPGVDILSTSIDGYTVLDGTSMASPFVAGVAGLIKSRHPSYSPDQLKAALLNSVDHPELLGGNFTVTDGRVNAARAVSASPSRPSTPSDGTIEGALSVRTAAQASLNYVAGDANDVFAKRLVKGRRYAILLRVPKRADYDLYLWKPGVVDIWQIDGQCGGFSCYLAASSDEGLKGEDEFTAFRARATGVYYIHLAAAYGKGTYSFAIVQV